MSSDDKFRQMALAEAEKRYKCAHCHNWFPEDEVQADHIVARILGGNDSASNRQLLCIGCHKVKSKLDMLKAQQFLGMRKYDPYWYQD